MQKIILGTVQFGLNYGINNLVGKPNAETVFDMLDYAYDQGIKILDTAFAYGNAQEIIGDYHRKKGVRFHVDTKFEINQKTTITSQLETAMDMLAVQEVDTFYYHSFDDMVMFPSSLNELSILKHHGKIRKIGISVYDNEQFLKAIETVEMNTIQLPFNLLDNMKKRGPLMQQAKDNGKEIIVRSSFLQGLFFKDPTSFPKVIEPLKKYILLLQDIAKENGMEMEQLALSYVSSQKNIDHVIIGVDNIEQLKSNIKHFNYFLTDEIRNRIDKIDVEETDLLYPYNWK